MCIYEFRSIRFVCLFWHGQFGMSILTTPFTLWNVAIVSIFVFNTKRATQTINSKSGLITLMSVNNSNGVCNCEAGAIRTSGKEYFYTILLATNIEISSIFHQIATRFRRNVKNEHHLPCDKMQLMAPHRILNIYTHTHFYRCLLSTWAPTLLFIFPKHFSQSQHLYTIMSHWNLIRIIHVQLSERNVSTFQNVSSHFREHRANVCV